MTPPILTLRQLNRATLARQMLLTRERTSPLAAIEQLVALQAQWPKPPFVGLWSRLETFHREDLAALLHSHQVVRSTAMRCTLHLMSARDYVNLRGTCQPVLTAAMQAVLKQRTQGIDLDRLIEAAKAFFAEAPGTFTALRAHLAERFPDVDERAMGYAVRTHLPLVQVPTDATWAFPGNSEFALAEPWIGQPIAKEATSPEALVLRYLAAFGPASAADMQTWTGLKSLKSVFAALKPGLAVFKDERGRELFDLPAAPRPDAETPAPVRFLQEFDNLVLGHDERSRVVSAAHRPSIILPGLRIPATFLVDGFVAGTWQVERKKRAATLLVEPFDKLTKPVLRELETEGHSLVRFLEADAETFAVRFSEP